MLIGKQISQEIAARMLSVFLSWLPWPLQQSLKWLIQNHLIIKKIRLIEPFFDDPYFPQYTVEISVGDETASANGIGESHQEALSKTIGEAVERYSLDVYDKSSFQKAVHQQLIDAADPLSFAGLSKTQRQQAGWEQWRITEDSAFYWIKGLSLTSKKEVWVPAQLVYKPYLHESWEPIINLPITSGAAVALSQEEAILHGVSELIEREAFMMTYLNRLAPPKINLKESGKDLIHLAVLFEKYQLDLDIYLLPTDAPLSVMLAVILDANGRGPAITVGLGANSNPVKAARAAILEANHTRVAIRRQIENGARIPEDRSDVILPRDHALFWAPLSRIKDLDFIKGGAEMRLENVASKSRVSSALLDLLHFFRSKSLEIVWIDLTLPQFRKSGIFAGKAISPQLHPLFIDERYPYYGGERLYKLPVELGYGEKPLTEEELNHMPHPFP